MREKLPQHRRTTRVKVLFDVELGHRRAVFIDVGFYSDGRVGEVFIDTAKEGTFLRDIMHALAHMISIALQYGTPVEEVIDSLSEYAEGSIGWAVASLLSQLELERINTICGPPDVDLIKRIRAELDTPERKVMCTHINYKKDDYS